MVPVSPGLDSEFGVSICDWAGLEGALDAGKAGQAFPLMGGRLLLRVRDSPQT